MKPTADQVRELLNYDPETGALTWKRREERSIRDKIFNGRFVGRRAGCLDPSGYRHVRVNGRKFKEHHLVWLWVNGVWPNSEMDHINRVASDNRIANLRFATRSENCANRPVHRQSKSGIKGVHFQVSAGRWRAEIQVRGKPRYLGLFDTSDEAAAAYERAAAESFGDFNPKSLARTRMGKAA